MKIRVLCVDDEQDQCDLMEMALAGLGFAVSATCSPHVALDLLTREPFDVVVTDLSMEEMDGLALCERVLGARPGIPVVVLTGQGSMETAIRAMRAGAYDFLTKPVDLKLLQISIERASRHRRLTIEVERLREALHFQPGHSLLAGDSPAMTRVNDLIQRIAPTDAAILVCGETGSGKELVARALHAASSRSQGPFVALNCAAIPAQLLESELFGHARGAFTDAKTARQGIFLDATGGTIFLDEIGEMPTDMQAKLLRVLQERKVRPLGLSTEIAFDARLITATHRDLEAEVAARRFRQDLYYRINVVRIDVPALRDRGGDILTLASLFLTRAMSKRPGAKLEMSAQVAERLLAYDWPGNVRELENCIERAVALARFEQLTVEDLPERIRQYRADRFEAVTESAADIVPLEEIERRYITRVLKILGGNKAQAAHLLGLDRRTLYRKLEKYSAVRPEEGALP